ncbi:hypothetical protein [Corynebacterium ulceribovis]|uniref:hypothetical protein n=1 Tax=Corynebacterium ulceribovis TaxID=487732 RepID=UPI000367F371|nr:hypothetical protein [Corynebacterium ulceribovis]
MTEPDKDLERDLNTNPETQEDPYTDLPQAAKLPDYGIYRDGDAIVEAWRFDEQSAADGRTHATLIAASGDAIATVSSGEGTASVNTDEGSWEVDAPAAGPWTITPIGGEAITVTSAQAVKKLTDAKNFAVSGIGDGMVVTRESSSQFVFETVHGEKLGQFTSADRAVRNPRIEFDTDAGRALDTDAKIAVAFIARQLIHARTVSSRTIVMWVLVFLAVIAFLFWQVG